MKISNKLSLILLLSTISIPYSIADTRIAIEIVNDTWGTLKLKQHTGLESPLNAPMTSFNVGPGTQETLDIKYSRLFTYDKSGWQPTRNKIAPMNASIDYEVNGYRCRLQTTLNVSVVPGAVEPSYKPTWKVTFTDTGGQKFRCDSYIYEKMSTPPYSYTVVLTVTRLGT
jgi:hypothetical protein